MSATFMLVTEVRTDKPDRRVLINLASVQIVRPRAADDRPEVGSWICWNTLDEPMPVRQLFEFIQGCFTDLR